MERSAAAQLSEPPLYPTEMSPSEIVGFENMQIFIQHLRICKSGTSTGEFPVGRLNKEIGPANRDRIAGILDRLRSCGFFPLDVNERGKVVWMIATKSKSHREFESGLGKYQKMTMAQLQEAARSGFRAIREGLGHDIAETSAEERNFEEVFGR